MARPQKIGLDYFPVDVDMCNDDKIYMLEVECGLEGYALFMKLLMKIYDNSYYIKWEQNDAKIFAHKNSVGVNVINNLIKSCLCNQLFDENLYEEYNILTSKAIQKRYFKATSRRKKVEYEPKYTLVNVSEYNNLVNVHNNPTKENSVGDNGHKSTQRKVKKSKEKKSKGNNKEKDNKKKDKSQAPIKKIFDLYNEICDSLPNARKLSDSRRKHIKTRWKEEKDIDIFKKAFKKANASSFMSGNNDREWTANIDWIMKNNTNFNKILEGKYDDKEKQVSKKQEYDI